MVVKRIVLILLVAFFVALTFRSGSTSSSFDNNKPSQVKITGKLDYSSTQETKLLDDTFRIDIKSIDVTFDFFPGPDQFYMNCNAVVLFFMRPGQLRTIIHLLPSEIEKSSIDKSIGSIRLDDEALDISNKSDVRVTGFPKTSLKALEFQRDLRENIAHTLEISYRVALPKGVYWVYSDVNDILGSGNEAFFPSINTPHELARHILTFRVHSDKPYCFIGSGIVEKTAQKDIEEWVLDTEREVASYSVMFALFPLEDVDFKSTRIGSTDIRIMAFKKGPSIDQAISILEEWLPELEDNLGPFPMPRGLSVLLNFGRSGMEYYGATISSIPALKHEVFHMYFGLSAINKTYRDSWIDESIDMWYELSKNRDFAPISDSFSSNIVSGLSPVDTGFSLMAYRQGANIMQAVANKLGGRDKMIVFLKYLHQDYYFTPYTTMDFVDYLRNYAGLDMKQRFLNWLYTDIPNGLPSLFIHSKRDREKRKIKLIVPVSILKKYGLIKTNT